MLLENNKNKSTKRSWCWWSPANHTNIEALLGKWCFLQSNMSKFHCVSNARCWVWDIGVCSQSKDFPILYIFTKIYWWGMALCIPKYSRKWWGAIKWCKTIFVKTIISRIKSRSFRKNDKTTRPFNWVSAAELDGEAPNWNGRVNGYTHLEHLWPQLCVNRT